MRNLIFVGLCTLLVSCGFKSNKIGNRQESLQVEEELLADAPGVVVDDPAESESEQDPMPMPTGNGNPQPEPMPAPMPTGNGNPQPEPTPAPMPAPGDESKPELVFVPIPERIADVPAAPTLAEAGSLYCDASRGEMVAAAAVIVNDYRERGWDCNTKAFDGSLATPVEPHTTLERAALWHAMDMSYNVFVSHTGSDGTNSRERAAIVGWDLGWVNENIHAGAKTLDVAIQKMADSAPHCKHMMDGTYEHIGMACHILPGQAYLRGWVMELGKPPR